MTVKDIIVNERKQGLSVNKITKCIFEQAIDREDELLLLKTPSQRNLINKLNSSATIFVLYKEELICIINSSRFNERKYDVLLSYHNPEKRYTYKLYRYTELKESLLSRHEDKDLSYYYVDANSEVLEKRNKRTKIANIDILSTYTKFENYSFNYKTQQRYIKLASIYMLKLNAKAQSHIEAISKNIDITYILGGAVISGKPSTIGLDDTIKQDPLLSKHYKKLREITSLIGMLNKRRGLFSTELVIDLQNVREYLK
ncbi:MAG: hypothetical protein RSE41_00380 [Clostridia bacterium]